MIAKKGLLIVYRTESFDDFKQIARRVYKIDPTIHIVLCGGDIDPREINPNFFKLPMLVIYLVNPPPDDFKHTTPYLAVKDIDKLQEYEHFKKHHFPCLPIEKFAWGMQLDPQIYGDWVVLKPQNIQSTGKDVNMVPTRLIPTLKLSDFPDDHLIHQDGYYVQKFLKTGNRPSTYRATVFLGEVLSSGYANMVYAYPKEDSDLKTLLSTTVATNYLSHRTRHFIKDLEGNELALQVAKTFPKRPLLAIDMLKNEQTGEFFVLETNLGGNTWHFSSAISRHYPGYDQDARKKAILQYNAWDRAAEALVRKVNELTG